MDAFAADYLANLTADLTGRVLEAAGRRIRETFVGTEKEQALGRCLEAGIVALLASASAQEPDELDLLAAIFGAFFQDPDVGREVMVLLQSRSLDAEVLLGLLREAGYEERELPGLDPRRGLILFQRAILSAAAAEPPLQGAFPTQGPPGKGHPNISCSYQP